jgi:hypothetical protein
VVASEHHAGSAPCVRAAGKLRRDIRALIGSLLWIKGVNQESILVK